MAHQHGVYDSDTHFTINALTRQIKADPRQKATLIQHDHNSERFTFELPRYIEQHDMSLCNKVEIHYLNVDAKTKEEKKGVYVSEDLQISRTDSEKVTCSWLISNNATQLVGTLSFIVRFCCVEGSTVTYAWNTAVATVSISTGINAGEAVVAEYADILAQWKAELFNAGYINAATMQNELSVLKGRMDTFTSLPNGSTAGDAELADIRVGADTVTYPTAGGAVRGQIASILDKLKTTKVDYDETLVAVDGYYIQDTGKIFENESYSISKPIHIPAGYTLTFTARGYKTAVAMIAKLNADDTYTALVTSVDSEPHEYTYVTTEDLDIVFSWSTSRGYALHINTNIFNVVSVLSDRMLILLENAKNECIKEDYVSLSLFSKFGVIGDSYASGEVYFDEKFHDIYEISWGQILARKLGTTCVNFSAGGYSTRGWINNSKGLARMLDTEAQDIYYLCLGINDANNYGVDYLGTVADINEDYTQNPDTFFGNYAKIIGNIKEHAPHAKIVMSTMVPTTDTKAAYNAAIIEIANHVGIPYIVQTDDPFFTSDFYVKGKVQSHPVAVVYSGMANAIERLLKKCIIENFEYFKDAYMY